MTKIQAGAGISKSEASSTYGALWQPLTAYLAGAVVISPAGDLVTRKTSGTSGAVYDGANWSRTVRPVLPTVIGKYRTGISGVGSTYIFTEAEMSLGLFMVGAVETYDRITAEVTVAGSAGALVRPAVYQIDETTGLASLILDPGTIDGTVVAVAQLTINLTLQPGTYAIGTVTQGAATTRPSLKMTPCLTGSTSVGPGLSGFPLPGGLRVSPVTGALPASPTLIPGLGYQPLVYLRRSA